MTHKPKPLSACAPGDIVTIGDSRFRLSYKVKGGWLCREQMSGYETDVTFFQSDKEVPTHIETARGAA